MATTTSLLKSAASARAKQQAYQDSVMAFEWENSAKTAADWDWYQDYLRNRGQAARDPSDALTVQRKLRSAENQFVSQEIERASIDILEGRSTNTEKYGKMVELYYRAAERGNFDLAQNLRYRLDSLSITIQNEQEKAQGVARTLANNQVKDLKSLIKKMQKGDDGVVLGDGTIVKPFAVMEAELRAGGDTETGFWADARATMLAIQQVTADTYQSLTSQEAVDKLENDNFLSAILNGEATFQLGGKKLSMPEIDLAYRSANANNPLYSPVISRDATTGEQIFSLQKNKTDDFIWAVNDDGLYEAVEVQAKKLSQFQTLDTQITDEGSIVGLEGENGRAPINLGTGEVERDSGLSIRNRLAAAGIIAEERDGRLVLTTPQGVFTDAVIMPDGSIRYFGQPGDFSGGQAGLYQVDVLTGQTREVSPDETSDFGVASEFGGMVSKATDAGKNYIKNLTGLNPATRVLPLVANIGIENDFSGIGSAATTGMLQGAAMTRRQIEAEERARQEMAQRAQALLQPSMGGTNINQTPIRQIAANGQPVRQIKVQPISTPKLGVDRSYVPDRQPIAAPRRRLEGPIRIPTAPAPTPRLRVT